MAADLQEAGFDSWEFLTCRDSFERFIRGSVASVVAQRNEERDQSRANQIANSVGKMLTGKDG